MDAHSYRPTSRISVPHNHKRSGLVGFWTIGSRWGIYPDVRDTGNVSVPLYSAPDNYERCNSGGRRPPHSNIHSCACANSHSREHAHSCTNSYRNEHEDPHSDQDAHFNKDAQATSYGHLYSYEHSGSGGNSDSDTDANEDCKALDNAHSEQDANKNRDSAV